jgi:formyl-CoA transferase
LEEVFANEQVVSRQIEMHVPHPTAGTMKLVSSPMKLSATPVEVRMAPPTLGQHTDEVLRERLGLSTEQITALRNKQAI